MRLSKTASAKLQARARRYSDEQLQSELLAMLTFGAPIESKLILSRELDRREALKQACSRAREGWDRIRERAH